MLNKELPFLRVVVPLSFGIISGLYIRPGFLFISVSLIILTAGFLLSLAFNKRLVNNLYGYCISLSIFLCGMLLYRFEKKNLSEFEPVEHIFHCSVSGFPEEKENSFKMILKLHSKIENHGERQIKGSLLIYLRKESEIRSLLPGDLLRISCTPLRIVNRGNPDEFDYRFYMENHGIKYYCFAGSEDILGHSLPQHRNLKHKALIIRESIIRMFRECGITEHNLPLVAAITLGDRSMLDADQKQTFIKAGIMHIMAVSGLHAGIISLFVFNILFFMKRKLNLARTLITIIFLWIFAFITGLTPSVLRATFMFSFLHAGKLIKRNANNLNSVFASAFILILIRPSVIFDAGFLLSYSAVISIICFYKEMYNKLNPQTWIGDRIWRSVAVTIVAQAGTLPLTVSLFNRFPLWFILTNIIIVPLASVLIITGCLIPITYPLKFISHPLALLLNQITWLTEKLTIKAAGLPLSTIENIGMGNYESILLYFVIFLFLLFLMNRKEFPIRYPLLGLLFFVSFGTIRNISDRGSSEIIVYNSLGPSQIGIRTGRILNLYSDNDTILPDVARHCNTRGLKIKLIRLDLKINLFQAGNKRILISNNLPENILQETCPEIIILNGKYPVINLKSGFNDKAEAIILLPDVASGYKFISNSDMLTADTIHYVRNSGAFRIKL